LAAMSSLSLSSLFTGNILDCESFWTTLPALLILDPARV
jgi:cation transporter-like permease